MEELERINKLNRLYNECILELKEVGIDILNEKEYGTITIGFTKRKTKRYGGCKNSLPDLKFKEVKKIGRRKYIKYNKFNKHEIEISKWVIDLNEDIIKNTIMHELIHCLPYCNDHGKYFKYYAKIINQKFGYDIQRVGNKKEDYLNSNLEYSDEENTIKYNYLVKCTNCSQEFKRQRINKDFVKKYKCGICNNKFEVIRL